MKERLLQWLEIGGISALLYTVCTCLLLVYSFFAPNLFDTLAYHHTNSEFWVMLWVVFPALLSWVSGIVLFQGIQRRQQVTSANGAWWSLVGRFLRTYCLLFFILFGFTVITNKVEWGYFVARPSLNRHVRNAYKILTITPVATIFTDQEKTFAVQSENRKFHQEHADLYGRKDPYYGDTDRIFMAFDDRAPFYPALSRWFEIYQDASKKLSLRQVQMVYAKIVQSRRLVNSQEGYPDGQEVYGNLVEFIDTHDRRWLYAGVGTAEISNDHYVFYEFIFSVAQTPDKWEPTLISYQKYFYDVAGMEGVEFTFFPFLGVSGLLLSLGITFGGTLLPSVLKRHDTLSMKSTHSRQE